MNPPYHRSMHLKILAEALKHLAPSGKLISLQPIKQWQKADLLRTEPPITGTFVAEVIRGDIANIMFGISTQDLGIITSSKDIPAVVLTEHRELLDKLVLKLSSLPSIYLRKSKKYKQWSLNIAENSCRIHTAAPGKMTEGCYQIVETTTRGAFEVKKLGPSTVVVDCGSEREREFAWSFYRLTLLRYVYKTLGFGYVPGKFVPDWRAVAVDGDYARDYEDADLYQFFNITSEEQKVIEETMKKYAKED